MKVFKISFDGTDDYVEAETMQDAISLWQEQMVADNDGDQCFLEETPEGCWPMADLPVIRKSSKPRVSRFTNEVRDYELKRAQTAVDVRERELQELQGQYDKAIKELWQVVSAGYNLAVEAAGYTGERLANLRAGFHRALGKLTVIRFPDPRLVGEMPDFTKRKDESS